jgi:hypothetical protein
MFRHRKQLRRWAARVLLLWLFGVGSGVANACLAPNLVVPGGPPSGHATVVGVLTDDARVAGVAPCHRSTEDHQVVGTVEPQGAPGMSICQDFCDKATVSIPPLKFALDDVQGHALLRAIAPVFVAGSPASPIQQWVPRRDGVRAPPIPIAFLRLTL